VLELQDIDLVVDDVMPLVLARSYPLTPLGVGAWAFGKGSALDYDIELEVGYGKRIADLVLPTGQRLGFDRTTDGYDAATAVFEHTATATVFRGAQVVWNGAGWDLVMADGTTLVFDGETGSELRAIRDPAGNQVTIRRALTRKGREAGDVVSAHSPAGRSLSFTYDDRDRLTEASDQLGRTVAYGYDAEDRLATVTHPDGTGRSYGYDDQHRLRSIGGLDGQGWVTNTFDEAGRVVGQVRADGSTFTFAYNTDAAGAVTQTEVTDPAGVVRRVAFSGGYLVTDTAAVGTAAEQTVTIERQPGTELVTAVVDPAGMRTAYAYDDAGYPTAVTVADGTDDAVTTTVGYDERFHQVTEVTDPVGRATLYRYDDRGNKTGVVDPAGGETTYRYDQRGRVVSVTDPAGSDVCSASVALLVGSTPTPATTAGQTTFRRHPPFVCASWPKARPSP
jgi:YD repeat-containing protein